MQLRTLPWALLLLLASCKSEAPPERPETPALVAPPSSSPTSEHASSVATPAPFDCHALTEECRAGSPQQATATPSDRHALRSNGENVLYNGQETDFDAASFRYSSVEGCAPHGKVFAWDEDDVYLLSPQSCGPNSCGEGYTGYFWSPLGVEEPLSFRWLSGGYATDGTFFYSQWHHGPIDTKARASDFEVFLCGKNQTPFAFDGLHWFEDGQRRSTEDMRRSSGENDRPADTASPQRAVAQSPGSPP